MDHDANAEAWGWKPEFHASWAAAMEKKREDKRKWKQISKQRKALKQSER